MPKIKTLALAGLAYYAATYAVGYVVGRTQTTLARRNNS